jgi:hypothetical protein
VSRVHAETLVLGGLMLEIKKKVFFPAIMIVLVGIAVGQHRFPTTVQIRKGSERIFGTPIDTKKNVFEVNKRFVLEILSYNDDQFVGFAVYPNYGQNNCNKQWEGEMSSPELAFDEYQALLKKISSINKIGPLKVQGKLGPVTNSRMFLVDTYANSYVENVVFSDYFANHQTILAFNVYYLKQIRLKAEAKTRDRIKAGEYWYLGDAANVRKAVMGKSFNFPVAGPLNVQKVGCN